MDHWAYFGNRIMVLPGGKVEYEGETLAPDARIQVILYANYGLLYILLSVFIYTMMISVRFRLKNDHFPLIFN